MRLGIVFGFLSIPLSQSSGFDPDWKERGTIRSRGDVEQDLDWSDIGQLLHGDETANVAMDGQDVDGQDVDGQDLSALRNSMVSDDLDAPDQRSPVQGTDIEPYRDCQLFNVGGDIQPLPNDYRVNCKRTRSVSSVGPREVNVYFIRHAESVWNEVTDKNFLQKIVLEVFGGNVVGFKGLTDAHLSDHGLMGALSLYKALNSNCKDQSILECDDAKFLAGKQSVGRKAIFATSNLRRAILTALIAFKNRILDQNSPGYIEEIHILSLLQEITGNTDSIPVTKPGQIPWLSFRNPDEESSSSTSRQVAPQKSEQRNTMGLVVNLVSRMTGTLQVAQQVVHENSCPFTLQRAWGLFAVDCHNQDENHPEKGKERDILQGFCGWMHNQAKLDPALTDFVLTGHSIWIRKFFQKFFKGTGANADDIALQVRSSRTKLSNESILKFRIELNEAGGCKILHGETKMVRGTIKPRLR